MDLKKETMYGMFVKRGVTNNKNNSSHFSGGKKSMDQNQTQSHKKKR
jgi:hypothetical protein